MKTGFLFISLEDSNINLETVYSRIPQIRPAATILQKL